MWCSKIQSSLTIDVFLYYNYWTFMKKFLYKMFTKMIQGSHWIILFVHLFISVSCCQNSTASDICLFPCLKQHMIVLHKKLCNLCVGGVRLCMHVREFTVAQRILKTQDSGPNPGSDDPGGSTLWLVYYSPWYYANSVGSWGTEDKRDQEALWACNENSKQRDGKQDEGTEGHGV